MVRFEKECIQVYSNGLRGMIYTIHGFCVHQSEDAARQVQIGDRLRSLPTERGISVRTLAGSAGFSPSLISQIENGQVTPSIASLERLAEALGIARVGYFKSRRPLLCPTKT
jgi:DNA-binding XRE family transcriptional regulator